MNKNPLRNGTLQIHCIENVMDNITDQSKLLGLDSRFGDSSVSIFFDPSLISSVSSFNRHSAAFGTQRPESTQRFI
uniref:Uncharacterized protein n=1 Tax=Glossina palpalis gambiensis TaxID=67801 RepID=A0A1B0BQ89_9MUSC